jgi:hypothetical protein
VRVPDLRVDPDLTPEYVAALRRLDGAEKLRAVGRLYWMARSLKAAALRDRNPDWTEDRIQAEVSELFAHAGT